MARTGLPEAAPILRRLFDSMNMGRQLVAARDLNERADPKSLDALFVILRRGDFRARKEGRAAVQKIVDAQPEARETIGRFAMGIVQDPRVWDEARGDNEELDDIIEVLGMCPVPLASHTLLRCFPKATVREQAAMLNVASLLKDEPSLQMVHLALRELNGNPYGLMGACRTVGELGDIGSVPALIRLLSVRDRRVPEVAHEALKKVTLESHGRGALPWHAWWESFLKKARNVNQLCAEAETGSTEKERVTALRMLAILRPPEAARVLTRCARDASPIIRTESLRGLARICGAESLSLFVYALSDKAVNVQDEALKALHFRTEQPFGKNPADWNAWFQSVSFTPGRLDEILARTASISHFKLPPARVATAATPSIAAPGAVTVSAAPPITAAVEIKPEESLEDEPGPWTAIAFWGTVLLVLMSAGTFILIQTRNDANRRSIRKVNTTAAHKQLEELANKLGRKHQA